MLLILLVNLYTSRVILQTLGFDDYGIYNLVGGLVSLFAFMNSSLSGAASRFIAYTLGEGRGEGKTVFSTLLSIHSIVAVILVILCETVGIILFDNLVIPENRMYAAKITFHLSVIATAISILRIPYNASIIAHEDMKIFAYVSIVEVLLKLLIAFLLNVVLYDKLIVYSWLYLAVVVIISLFYLFYCVISYREANSFIGFDKRYFKKVVGFFSWDLYGNLSMVANAQGTNIILNLFGGVVINSACAIANQVRGAVNGFASNFMLAMNPQIVKTYAAGEREQMNCLMIRGGLLSFCLLWIFALPLMLEIDFVLDLWLDEVPEYTSAYVVLSLIFSLVQTLYSSVNIGIHATGKIKMLSFIGGTLLMSSVLVSYYIMRFVDNLLIPFIANIIIVSVSAIINLYIMRHEMNDFAIKSFMKQVYFKAIQVILVSLPIPLGLHLIIGKGVVASLLVIFVSVINVAIVFYYMVLTSSERTDLINLLRTKLQRNA